MRNEALFDRLLGLFGEYANDHLAMENRFQMAGSPALSAPSSMMHASLRQLTQALSDLCRRQASEMADLASDFVHGDETVRAALRHHSLFTRFLMQSALVAEASRKGSDALDSSRLLWLSHQNGEADISTYGHALDHVLLDCPIIQAFQARTRGLASMLATLPTGARVLGLSCGPALEIQHMVEARLSSNESAQLSVDLLDHDVAVLQDNQLRYSSHVQRSGVDMRYGQYHLIDLLNGQEYFEQLGEDGKLTKRKDGFCVEASHYDFVYAPALASSIRYTPGQPSRGITGLTKRLFSLLKPGGTMVMGNVLQAGGAAPYSHTDRFILSTVLDMRPIHRNARELLDFSQHLPVEICRRSLLCESLAGPLRPEHVFGFLQLERLQ